MTVRFLVSRVALDTMNISKLKSKAEGLVTQLTAKDACEKRVLDAIGGHSYAAPRSLLNEIAEDTFSHERYVQQYYIFQEYTVSVVAAAAAAACKCMHFAPCRQTR